MRGGWWVTELAEADAELVNLREGRLLPTVSGFRSLIPGSEVPPDRSLRKDACLRR
jgi:hypothetical protein